MNEPTIRDKDYTWKQKLEYFWMYYKVHTIIAIVAVIVVGSLLKTWIFQKDMVLLVSAFDTGNTEVTTIEEDFMAYAGVDTAHEDVVIQHDGPLSSSTDQYAIANNMKVVAQVNSGELDILITLPDKFEEYSKIDCYRDLRDIYTEEELAAFDGLVTDENGRILGIRASQMPGMEKYGLYQHDEEELQGIIGIVLNSGRVENAKKFIKFLMETNR